MSQEAQIMFKVEDKNTEQFVKESAGDFATLLVGGNLQVIIKEVKEGGQSLDKVRMIAGAIARSLTKRKVKVAKMSKAELNHAFFTLDDQKAVVAFVEGWHLGTYRFDTYKQKKEAEPTSLQFQGSLEQHSVEAGEARAAAVAFSRDLMNEIPSKLNPETFPTILQKQFAGTGVNVIVHDKPALEEMEMNGILAVNRGSKYDPAFIELHYEGNPTKPLIALVGKGVTFDTGGISLKHARDLSDMRMDMGGAAAVAGAMKLLAASNADVNVVGLIQTVENIPDRHSLLPGDVIRFKNGKSVQVGNTDAEGRLILADGLIRAGELNAAYVVDIATLTGAIVNALGPKLGGIFGDEDLMLELKKIGDENGDFVWPMPLVEEYEATLSSDYADFSNISNQGPAGAITAALFLRKFVPEKTKWIHVDMAGVMDTKTKGYYHQAATGFGARLLADYAVHVSE